MPVGPEIVVSVPIFFSSLDVVEFAELSKSFALLEAFHLRLAAQNSLLGVPRAEESQLASFYYHVNFNLIPLVLFHLTS